MSYIDRINEIASKDCDTLRRKDKEYGGSWLKRGGVGAFMMAARKWDRLEEHVSAGSVQPGGPPEDFAGMTPEQMIEACKKVVAPKFDIIQSALLDQREEGVLDDIGDLRRYLLLIEAEIRERQGNGITITPNVD